MCDSYQYKLKTKIREVYGLDEFAAYKKAKEVRKLCTTHLLPNVVEWIEGRPLTDIYVDKYTIPMILTIWNNQDFLKALEVICELQLGNKDIAERRIWQMRR
ncbi:MAG: hypothetical protein K6G88_03765 [Lachnospiraceae bacterium]|nr:hypothetical protein [Lachnospiraceae bacterium]